MLPKSESEIWKIIQRHVSGESTPEEDRLLNNWADETAYNRQMLNDIKEIWALSSEEDIDVDLESAWRRFHRNNVKKSDSYLPSRESRNKNMRLVALRAAAIFLICALVGFFAWKYVSLNNRESKHTEQYAMQTLKTQNGKKAQVTFSDGTVVTLNVASTLRFAKTFSGGSREVFLNGEAYFDVVHKENMPFIVHTAKADIKDIGTKFNVQAWEEDGRTVIGVKDGAVKVDSHEENENKSGVLIKKGQYTIVNNGYVASAKTGDIGNFLAWMGGGLYFDDMPFSMAVNHIERKYDVQISIADSELKKVPFTGTFRNADLKEVLDVVCTSMNLTYKRDKKGIVLLHK